MKKAALISAFFILVIEAYQGFFYNLSLVLHSSNSVAYKAGFTTAQVCILATAVILAVMVFQIFKPENNVKSVFKSKQSHQIHSS